MCACSFQNHVINEERKQVNIAHSLKTNAVFFSGKWDITKYFRINLMFPLMSKWNDIKTTISNNMQYFCELQSSDKGIMENVPVLIYFHHLHMFDERK